MSRPRLLADRVASVRGVSKPTIVCSGLGRFYVRLPGEKRPAGPLALTWEEALACVRHYYRKGNATLASRNVFGPVQR